MEGGREGGREGLGGLVYGLKKNVLHSKAASSEMSRLGKTCRSRRCFGYIVSDSERHAAISRKTDQIYVHIYKYGYLRQGPMSKIQNCMSMPSCIPADLRLIR